MSSTALKIFAAVSVLVAVVLAVIGYRMSRGYAQQSEAAQQQLREQKAQQQAQQTLAVVAIKPLAAYKPIERDAVALVSVAVKPADPYDSIDAVVGKQPLVDIDVGAPITRRYFREGNLLARAIPPGYQAVSISVTDVLAVGGFLRPGDVVDILLFLRGAEGVEQPQSRVLLERVRVLAYLEQVIDRPQGVEGEDANRARQARTAVLAIPEKDTTKLMLGASLGELRLALHGQIDEPGATAAVTGPQAPAPAPAPAPAAAPTTAVAGSKPELKPRPEKAITSAELARIKPQPGAGHLNQVEIFRGNDRTAVVTK